MATNLEELLLKAIHEGGSIADSGNWASSLGYDHASVVSVIKSLLAYEMVTTSVSENSTHSLAIDQRNFLTQCITIFTINVTGNIFPVF